ncbi:N-acetyltransferase [Methylobacter sp. BBA5.1]|uniref:N-acetyltransferase n=1 Tax=Methylobacter sp. BBA5.1 TaxID=1495064 RepID=UPI00055F8684|nr:N-acetyltransferase [Methylobacter sp. BBA5.1]
MSKNMAASLPSASRIFTKETLINGRPAQTEHIKIGKQTFSIERGLLTVVRLEDEWYEDIDEPQAVARALQENPGFKPDLFTFWQRMPDVEPRYAYYQESEDLAVIPITTYDHWWSHQIKSRVRSQIRKAEKDGVVVRETVYDDDFVYGMTAIFNEAPIRQGRKFWHYGKDFETVKRQFSRYLFREHMIGAYYQGEMIGFMMLGDAGRFGLTGQIISSLKHRDKSPNNALIAKAVEVCAARKLDYLIYVFWSDDSLAEFKRRCGFQKVSMPRYYIPLTWKGEFVLKCGAHRGWRAMLPQSVKKPLKQLRGIWNGLRQK